MMFKIKYKFLFVYNVVFNSIGFCMIFPSDLGGKPLYLEDVNPPDLAALVELADERLDEYKRVEPVIKNSSPWRHHWMLAEYDLEEARINRMARTLGLSPLEIKNERRAGNSWADICFTHLITPAAAGIASNSRHESERDNQWFVWRCYYSPESYAIRKMISNITFFEYGAEGEEPRQMNQDEWRALLFSSTCLDCPAENDGGSYISGVIYPHTRSLVEQSPDLSFYCGSYFPARAKMAYINNLRRICTDGSELCAGKAVKLINYEESAGCGESRVSWIERRQVHTYIDELPVFPAGRLNFCY